MSGWRYMLAAVAAALGLHAFTAHAEDEPAKGWLVFSISKDIGYTSAQLRIRQVGGKEGRYYMGFTNFSSMKGEMVELAPGRMGKVSAAQLPAGTYEIFNYRLEFPASNTEFTSRGDFSVRFEVKPLEVAYLGEFLATAVMTKAFLGMRNVDKPYFIFSDQRERDVALAAKAQPEIAGLPVAKAKLMVKGHTPFTTKRLADPAQDGAATK